MDSDDDVCTLGVLMVGVAAAVIHVLCIYKKGKCMHESKPCIFHVIFHFMASFFY